MKSNVHIALIVTLLFAFAAPSFGQTVAAPEDEDKLIAVLKSDGPLKEKVDACRQLAIIAGKDAVPTLAALLDDEKLSHMARYALEPIPDPSVDDAFRAALGRLDGRPLVGVIGSIGVRRDAQAVEPLTQLLVDGQASFEAQQAAVRALGSIGTVAAADFLLEALDYAPPEGQLDVCEGLFRCAERFASEGNRAKAIAIYDTLRGLDAAHQVRAGGLRGAILTRGEDGVPLLREHLRNNDYILFSAAVQAAQEMTCAGVTQVLTVGLDGLPADNQILVIQTLGKRGDPAALPALSKAAQSGPVPVRVAAVRAMPDIGDDGAVPMLVELIGADKEEVAQAAQEALGALPGDRADKAVIALFAGSDREARATALALMGRRRMTSSIPMLLASARGGDAEMRPAVIKMVGELGDADQLPALLDLLMKVSAAPDIAAAEQAIDAVCKKAENPQAHAGRLIGLLDEAAAPQKVALLRVLGAIGGADALQAVRGAVDSRQADVRSTAIRTLSTWNTPDAAPLLLALAKSTDKPNERTLFLRGYLGIAGRRNLPVRQRLDMCREAAQMLQRDDERKLLLGTLGNIESPATLALIVPHLDNAGTRQEAGMAAVAVAEKLLKSKNAARHAPKLIAPLEKVTQAAVSDALKDRARGLLQQAKDKAGNQ